MRGPVSNSLRPGEPAHTIMKLLHTSDWHLGRALYGRKRYDEYEAFLNWLADYIEREDIDVLLVAGDVFDNSTPSNRAQELYYRFLCRVAASPAAMWWSSPGITIRRPFSTPPGNSSSS